MSSFVAKFWQPSNANATTIISLHSRHYSRALVIASNTSEKITQRRWHRVFKTFHSTKIFILPIISFITLLIALVILFILHFYTLSLKYFKNLQKNLILKNQPLSNYL